MGRTSWRSQTKSTVKQKYIITVTPIFRVWLFKKKKTKRRNGKEGKVMIFFFKMIYYYFFFLYIRSLNRIIMDFLVVEGHKDAAEAFQRESMTPC